MKNELVLKHIDQLYARLEGVWIYRDRAVLVLLLTSVGLWGAIQGLIQAPSELSGFAIKPELVTEIFVVVSLLGITLAYSVTVAMDIQSDILAERIQNLYEAAGYDKKELSNSTISPLSSHHPLLILLGAGENPATDDRTILGTVYDMLTALFTVCVIALLPIVAVFKGGYWFAAVHDWSVWSILFAIICLGVSVVTPIMGVLRTQDRSKRIRGVTAQ